MTPDEQQDFIQKHAGQIAEHFDCIQILASRLNDRGDTEVVAMGSGNWYARLGMAREMLDRETARTQRKVMMDEEGG